MLRIVATVGYLGCIPFFGRLLASLAGLVTAILVYRGTGAVQPLAAIWALVLVATIWALPRALREDPDAKVTVIDRYAGIWLAAAPAIPLADLLGSSFSAGAIIALATPVLLYTLLLSAPRHLFDRDTRPVLRLVDDLVAGALAAIGTLAVMLALLRFLPEALPT
ncbi:phosphatidylglycerophosphatase A [Aliiruegeria lutimaris]|uniref:Phosphatidylglycerophosphatase A n=1 Tax=Aliiruegeria lutimaris TaxID=571298 RepID=A0A1G9B4P4_9RHOB|nr:phosphatidylglycerophosphatase A [Aliiruegeria lutimaris]SDK34517.1 Phosphatidylglycerophosphatase A [Aliiruegeria lutimaris]